MSAWRAYGTIFVSAGIAVYGLLWYGRPSGAVRGEDVAECLAAKDERFQIAYLTGTNGPADHHIYMTNVVSVTNASLTVAIWKSYGSTLPYLTPASMEFTIGAWTTPQTLSLETYPDFGYWDISFSSNGVTCGSIRITNTFIGPSVPNPPATVGPLTVDPGGGTFHVNTPLTFGVVPNMPTVSHYTNSVIAGIQPGYAVSASPSWDLLYYGILDPARRMADDAEAGNRQSGMMYWLPEAVTDGMAVASAQITWHGGADPAHTAGSNTTVWMAAASNSLAGALTCGTRYPVFGMRFIDGVSGTNLPFASHYYPACNASPANASLFGGTGNWWTNIGMGTNVYAWRCDIVTGRVTAARNKVITTNRLNEARAVMGAMTRTAVWFDPYQMTYSNAVTTVATVHYASNDVWQANGGTPGVSNMIGAASVCETRSVITNHTWDDSYGWHGLYDADIAGTLYEWHNASSPAYEKDETDVDYIILSRKFTGCRFPYPCDMAFASGYVARVSVYAVGTCRTPQIEAPMYFEGVPMPDDPGTDFTRYSTYPGVTNYESLTYGILSCVSEHGLPSSPFLFDQTHVERADGANAQAAYRAALVFQSSANPTTRPSFTLGTGDIAYPSLGDIATVGVDEYDHNHTDPADYQWRRTTQVTFAHQIDVLDFIVVVDWNWKHLNPVNPFEPDTFKPAWMGTNTVTEE